MNNNANAFEVMMFAVGMAGKRKIGMFKDNLIQIRKMRKMTQEDVAEKVGVTRQAVAKWESGETVPDLDKCRILAEVFGVSLDDLANYEADRNFGLGLPPKGKHLFGLVTVGEKGQIVIPARARKIFNLRPGDQLMVLGDEDQGLALVDARLFMMAAEEMKSMVNAAEAKKYGK